MINQVHVEMGNFSSDEKVNFVTFVSSIDNCDLQETSRMSMRLKKACKKLITGYLRKV